MAECQTLSCLCLKHDIFAKVSVIAAEHMRIQEVGQSPTLRQLHAAHYQI